MEGQDMRRRCGSIKLAVLVAVLGAMFLPAFAQSLDKSGRERGRRMLDRIKEDLKKSYYDPAFRGINLDAHFKAASDKMEQATLYAQAVAIVAQSLLDLDDRHTWIVPVFVNTFHYGWRMQLVGDKCYVISVVPGSDAAAKGIRSGDEVYSIDGFWPVRENMWKLDYLYRILGWKPEIQVVLREADGRQRALNEVISKFKKGPKTLGSSST
jgi:C-terminal processing protease CtpA/Prc